MPTSVLAPADGPSHQKRAVLGRLSISTPLMASVLLCYLAAYDDLEGAVANNPGPLDLDEPDEKGWTPVQAGARDDLYALGMTVMLNLPLYRGKFHRLPSVVIDLT